MSIIRFGDLAISRRMEADYTVGVTSGVDGTSTAYVLDLKRGHWDFNRTLVEIEAMGTFWLEVQAIGIEQVAYQAAALQEAPRRAKCCGPRRPGDGRTSRTRRSTFPTAATTIRWTRSRHP